MWTFKQQILLANVLKNTVQSEIRTLSDRRYSSTLISVCWIIFEHYLVFKTPIKSCTVLAW
jgi:hypothetical protein